MVEVTTTMDHQPITLENLIEQHKKLIQAVYDYDYYVNAFEYTRENFEFDLSKPEQISSFWHEFWYTLPDHPAIRRDPFNRICDMAEGAYLYE